MEKAVATPGAVDTHDADVIATAERHAQIVLCSQLLFFTHCLGPSESGNTIQRKKVPTSPKKSNVSRSATLSGPPASFALIFDARQIRGHTVPYLTVPWALTVTAAIHAALVGPQG